MAVFQGLQRGRPERNRPGDGGAGRGASVEHRKLAEAAGAGALLRETGWIKVWRSARGEEAVYEEIAELKPYGIAPVLLDRAALDALEPHVGGVALGGAHFADPLTTPNPQGLTKSYAALFVEARRPAGDGRRPQSRAVGPEAGRLRRRRVR